MDINLRVSTGSTLEPNLSNENINSAPTKSAAESKNENTLINLTTKVGPPNINKAEPTVTTPKDTWATTLVSDLKSLFESFLTSISKLLEGVLGTKPTTTPAVTTTTQPNATPTPANTTTTPRKLESFVEHSAKNFISDLNGSISEEKMRENVIMYQLYQKDVDAESIFKSKLNTEKSLGRSSDEAIKSALIETEKSNKIQRWESDWVYSLSFRAAQTDLDLNSISVESGSSAATKTAAALQAAERNLVAIATGVEVPVMRNI